MKRRWFGALSLALIMTCSGMSGFQAIQNTKTNPAAPNDITVPDIDSTSAPTESHFSTTFNKMIASSEISFSSLNLTLTTTESDPICLKFTNFILDQSQSSSLSFNVSTTLEVTYKAIDEKDIAIQYESDGYAYIKYFNNSFTFEAPQTIGGVVKMIQAIGIALPNTNSGSDITVSSLKETLSQINVSQSDIKSIETQTLTGYEYLVKIPDITIGSTVVSSPSITITSDTADNFTGLSSNEITISTKNATDGTLTKKLSIALNGSGSLTSGTYQSASKTSFQDITDATGSILTTLTSIASSKKTNVAITASLTDSRKTDAVLSSTLTGTLQANASETFSNLAKGEYVLTLNHSDSTKTLNTVKAHYVNDTTYLQLNDLFKGRISNTNVDSIFKYISDASGEKAYQGLSDILNHVVSDTAFKKLMDGDTSSYKEFVKSFSYTENQNFELVVNSSAFGLGDGTITIDCNFVTGTNAAGETTETGVKNLTIKGLSYQKIAADFTFAFADYTDITAMTTEENATYTDFAGAVPIFTTLADMVGNKQVSANYSLIYKDNENSVAYSANGAIKADLAKVTADSAIDTSTVQGWVDHYGAGKYLLTASLNTGSLASNGTDNGLEHDVGVYYQDKSIYVGYNYDKDSSQYILRQCLPDNQIGAIKTVIDKHANDATSSIDSMGTLLDEIQASDNYKNLKANLDADSLMGLEGLLSVSNDSQGQLVVTVKPDYLLGTTSYAGKVSDITLTFNTGNSSLTSISVNGAFISSKTVNNTTTNYTNTLSFTVTFDTYVDTFLKATDEAEYTTLNNASQLVDFAYALPTQLEKFGVTASGSIASTSEGKTTTISLANSSAAVDLSNKNNPQAMGTFNITHPFIGDNTKTATQKLEFTYAGTFDSTTSTFSEHKFVGEYNDNMHISMTKADLDDIQNQIDSVKSDNLMYRYFKYLQNGTTSLPIYNIIKTKDISKLLAQKYVKTVTLTDTTITIAASPKLFDSSDTTDNTITLTISYTANGITSASISAPLTMTSSSNVVTTSAISATINMVSYSAVTAPSFSTSGYTVDMAGFRTLLDCLIDTTKQNYFHITGVLSVPVKVLGISSSLSLSAYCDARIFVADETAYAYLLFFAGSTSAQSLSTDGLRATEVFIKEKQVWMCQTKTSYDKTGGALWWTTYDYFTSSEVFKTTQKEVVKNIAYYIFDYILDMSSKTILGISAGKQIMGAIYKSVYGTSSTNVFNNNDFSQIISSATVNSAAGSNYGTFSLVMGKSALNNLFSIPALTFNSDVTIGLNYQTKDSQGIATSSNPFTSISINGGLDVIGGIGTITLSANFSLSQNNYATLTAAENGPMSRWKSFTDAFTNSYGEWASDSRPYYTITSIDSNCNMTDNASTAKIYFAKTKTSSISSGAFHFQN